MSNPLRLQYTISTPNELNTLSALFKHAGYELYLVGGAVRDALMGVAPKDFDVATNAVPDKIIDILKMIVGVTIIEVGKAFGVIKAVFPSGFECEIATFRYDVGVGRRPDSVVFSTIEDDVKRRDLTINALFYDISNFHIVDYVDGIEDVRSGVIRTVGNPSDRFNEDRLRMLRAIRFAAYMGCELEESTEYTILHDNALTGVSQERIRDEFLKSIKKAKSVTHLFAMLTRFEMWDKVFPGLEIYHGCVRETRDHIVLIAMLLHGNDAERLAKVLHNMKYSIEEIRQVLFLRNFTWFCFSNNESECKNQPLMMHKNFKISCLSDDQVRTYARFMRLPRKSVVNAFLKYKPSTSGESLLALGFKGKSLGVELERRERVRFIELLNDESRA